jgi:hypothetical protein
MQTLSQELKNRVKSEISHTEKLLTKQLSYLPENQKTDLIGFYTLHLAKLNGMLN